MIFCESISSRASLNRTFFTSIPVFQPRNTKTCDAPFSADTPRKKILPRREAARQVFWLVPAATPSRPSRTSGFQRVAATIGTYSSGNCCRFSRHSLLIGQGVAEPLCEPLRNKSIKNSGSQGLITKKGRRMATFPSRNRDLNPGPLHYE